MAQPYYAPSDSELVVSKRAIAPLKQAVKVLLLSATFFTCCIIYGRTFFYRDPGSIFYDEEHAYVRWYSAYREKQAEHFLNSAKQHHADELKYSKAGEHPGICGTFLTVARNGIQTQYLENSIASALDRLTRDERADVDLKVFFADLDPTTHPTWHQPWLRTLVDEAYGYADISPEAVNVVRQLDGFKSPFYKSVWDYSYGLEYCYNKSPAPYIAMFEDDIMIAQGWVSRVLLAVKEVEAKTTKAGKRGSWLYVRLFNEERATGWGNRNVGGNHEVAISLAAGLVVWLSWRTARHHSRIIRRVQGGTIAVLCFIVIPAFIGLFFQAGKASMLPPSPGVKDEFFGCCAQAIVFNREHMPGLAHYLKTANTGLGQDHVTRDYAYIHNLTRWSLYPMSVQHVGSKSTIQTDKMKAQEVWSMAFEELNPKRVCREHEKAVRKLYGNPRKLCT